MSQEQATNAIAGVAKQLRVDPENVWAALEEAANKQNAGRSASRLDRQTVVVDSKAVGVASGTVGVWTIAGKTSNGDDVSVVVKGIQLRENPLDPLWDTTKRSVKDPFHWMREVHAYRGALLDNPVGNVRTPKSYGQLASVDSVRERIAGIVIERVTGIEGVDMDRQEFLKVARDVGEMQGAFALRFAAESQPQPQWLSRGYFREYVSRVATLMKSFDESVLEEPLISAFAQERQGETLFQATNRMWDDRETFLKLTEAIPLRTLAHNDFWQGQVIRDAGGQTVVIDLAAMGDAPLGADIAKLTIEVIARDALDMDAARQFEAEMNKAYFDGLERAGVPVGETEVAQMVQLGWSASVAATESYRMGVDWIPMVHGDERSAVNRKMWGGRDPQDVFELYAQRSVRLIEHGELAREIAVRLEPLLNEENAAQKLLGVSSSDRDPGLEKAILA